MENPQKMEEKTSLIDHQGFDQSDADNQNNNVSKQMNQNHVQSLSHPLESSFRSSQTQLTDVWDLNISGDDCSTEMENAQMMEGKTSLVDHRDFDQIDADNQNNNVSKQMNQNHDNSDKKLQIGGILPGGEITQNAKSRNLTDQLVSGAQQTCQTHQNHVDADLGQVQLLSLESSTRLSQTQLTDVGDINVTGEDCTNSACGNPTCKSDSSDPEDVSKIRNSGSGNQPDQLVSGAQETGQTHQNNVNADLGQVQSLSHPLESSTGLSQTQPLDVGDISVSGDDRSNSACGNPTRQGDPVYPEDVSTQTACETVPDVTEDVFEDALGAEDPFSKMDVDEFITWFGNGDSAGDNKPDTDELPHPDEFRENQWSLENSQGMKVGTFGCYYEGDIDNKKMHGYGRLVLVDRTQFIEGRWKSNKLIELKFAQLTNELGNKNIFILKHIETYLITILEEKFISRAASTSFSTMNFAAPVWSIKSSLLRKFTIVHVVEDEVKSHRDVALNKFDRMLSEKERENANPLHEAAILILLNRHSKQKDAKVVLSAIARDACVPQGLQAAAQNLLQVENALCDRKLDMFQFSGDVKEQRRLDLREIIFRHFSQRINEHRQMLVNKCPSSFLSMLSTIESLPAGKILYITKDDVGVFEDLSSVTNSEKYLEFFEWLLAGFVNKLRKVEIHAPLREVIPLMFPVYGFLFKSFSEIITEICSSCENSDIADMLKNKSGNWLVKENLKWPDSSDETQTKKQKIMSFFKMSKRKITLGRQSLEVQYRFIFKLLMEFAPENYDKNRKYKYNFCVLGKDNNASWWQKGLRMFMEGIGLRKRLQDLPNERLVWLYILDHTVAELFKSEGSDGGNSDADSIINLYVPLIEGHVAYVTQSKSNSYESFRILTDSILRFIVSTAPYFKDARGNPGNDGEILCSQMDTITRASNEMENNATAFIGFKDLIAEYNRYWGLRLFVVGDTANEFFSSQIRGVVQKFMSIVKSSLNKQVNIPNLVKYIRSLNDFFDDFKDIDFLASWFVKSDFYETAVMEKVNNKLSQGGNCSYRVVDIGRYIELLGSRPIPQHQILLIMSDLLECIEKCLEQSGQEELVQIVSTGMLLDAVRRSLMYLKDQPDYVDFDTFRTESVDPFKRVVEALSTKQISLGEFKKRIEIIQESFWYIRKMDELGIEQALQQFKSVNSCYISNDLMACYNSYLSKYNQYIEAYNSYLNDGKSQSESLETVRLSIELPQPLHFNEWTKTFKTHTIPSLLAGLSAVWSILVSNDVSSTGKFLKPHCIQLLCVMRLLSVDQSDETVNHLAQVLTGQGKSLILGLLSSTLALTGHKVRVLCYSDYLSSRDQSDFKEFFGIFGVENLITYGTFDDMANVFLNPMCNGTKTNLREMVNRKVLNNIEISLDSVAKESKNTVLLIDEVDVFFSNQFYGNVYSSCTIPKIPGLAVIQEKIWGVAKGSKYEAAEVLSLTEKFIENAAKTGDAGCREFNAFRHKPRQKPLTLLVNDDKGNLQVKEYSNRLLIENAMMEMVKTALNVGNAKDGDSCVDGFRINDDGRICCRSTKGGKYVTHIIFKYLNTFNYFRLKGSDFEHEGFQNYGYLVLDTGRISYARLPSQFKLILGVSGTLKDLSEYERKGIQSYNINNFSILPSFFGESNLKFDPVSDFSCIDKEEDWLKVIYDKANLIVKSFRAVLIFFESETELSLFSREYRNKFDRFNEITENTSNATRDANVNEAGLSCAVTLASRGMGRGVDYKSSLAVEKNGGIHVIQTFYSVDVKEEVQIKGRTARKDNKGSYELVVCKAHLIKEKYIQVNSDSPSYSSLHTKRLELMNESGKEISARVEKSELNHRISMSYYGLSC